MITHTMDPVDIVLVEQMVGSGMFAWLRCVEAYEYQDGSFVVTYPAGPWMERLCSTPGAVALCEVALTGVSLADDTVWIPQVTT